MVRCVVQIHVRLRRVVGLLTGHCPFTGHPAPTPLQCRLVNKGVWTGFFDLAWPSPSSLPGVVRKARNTIPTLLDYSIVAAFCTATLGESSPCFGNLRIFN